MISNINHKLRHIILMRATQTKLLLVGDSGVGKTTLCLKWFDAEMMIGEKSGVPTLGVNVHTFVINGTNGTQPHAINVWDTAGNERFMGLGNGYYSHANVAIVVHKNDVRTQRLDWEANVLGVVPGIPIIHLVNVFDDEDHSPSNRPEEHTYFVNPIKGFGKIQFMNTFFSLMSKRFAF